MRLAYTDSQSLYKNAHTEVTTTRTIVYIHEFFIIYHYYLANAVSIMSTISFL